MGSASIAVLLYRAERSGLLLTLSSLTLDLAFTRSIALLSLTIVLLLVAGATSCCSFYCYRTSLEVRLGDQLG